MGLEFDIYQAMLWNQFFFFSVESLLATKMDRLTITQCIKIIKSFYKNGDSITATYRALRGFYGFHNRSTTQAIGKIMKKFWRDWSC